MRYRLIQRVLIALVPFWSIIIVLLIYSIFIKIFIYCDWSSCEGIPDYLSSVFSSANSDTLRTNSITTDIDKAPQEYNALLYSGRAYWTLLQLLDVFAAITTYAIAWSVIYRLISACKRRAFLSSLVIVILALGAGIYFYQHPDFYMRTIIVILDASIENDIPTVVEATNLVSSFRLSAIVLSFFAVISILLVPYASSSSIGLYTLSQRMKYLRILLFAGAFMLIIGTLSVQSIFQWSLAFIAPEERLLENVKQLFSNLINLWGSLYTVLLAIGYVPAAFILRRRAVSLKGLPNSSLERDKILTEHGLIFSFESFMPRVLAIFSPLLSGPIGQFIGSISN